MPVDANGNRAEVLVYGGSRAKRTNWGSLYEHFRNATTRDVVQRMLRAAGFDPHLKITTHQAHQATQDEQFVHEWFDYILGRYRIFSPQQAEMLEHEDIHGKRRHIMSLMKDDMHYHVGATLYLPANNPVNNLDAVREIMNSSYCPHYGPVTYRDPAGELVTTENPVLIGSMYMIMLEKTGEDWSAVASGKSNHFGVPAKLSNMDKRSAPGRQAHIRGIGESESRSWVSYVGPEVTTELMDQSNNPKSHRQVVKNILTHPTPTNIDRIVDRKENPLGHSRPVEFIRHVLECEGLEFVYHSPTEG